MGGLGKGVKQKAEEVSEERCVGVDLHRVRRGKVWGGGG